MPGPNGVPSGISAGALAVTRALQQGQVERNNSTRVVSITAIGTGTSYVCRVSPHDLCIMTDISPIASCADVRFLSGSAKVSQKTRSIWNTFTQRLID
jgi:hypothetical protein